MTCSSFDDALYSMCVPVWQHISAQRQGHLPVLHFAFVLYNRNLVLRVQIKTATLTQVFPETVLKSFCKPVPNTMMVFVEAL